MNELVNFLALCESARKLGAVPTLGLVLLFSELLSPGCLRLSVMGICVKSRGDLEPCLLVCCFCCPSS